MYLEESFSLLEAEVKSRGKVTLSTKLKETQGGFYCLCVLLAPPPCLIVVMTAGLVTQVTAVSVNQQWAETGLWASVLTDPGIHSFIFFSS